MARFAAARVRYPLIRTAGVIDALVRELAAQSTTVTRVRMPASSDQLEASELRGYVRARAASAVWSLVRNAAAEGRVSAAAADGVAARVLERTVHLVVREMMERRVMSEHLGLATRRAA
jgi:hypothetical protein